MGMSRRVRIAVVVAGVGGIVAATSGITYATTARSSASGGVYATACTNTHHGLRLISSGACPKGDSPIKLAAAPTPLAVSGQVSPSAPRTRKVTVGDFTVTALCFEEAAEAHSGARLTVSSSSGFVVQGSEVFTGNDIAEFSTSPGTAVAKGAGQISEAVPSADPTFQLMLSEDGGVTGDAVLVQGGHTVTVTFALFAFSANCSVQAQIAASS